jgi:pseudouridine-5'-phosphate glycosidase
VQKNLLKIQPEVQKAINEGRAVVALESTIISHGLPRPRNYEAAKGFEKILRDKGVIPATIAMINGVANIGLDEAGIDLISNQDIAKASVRDLPILAAKELSGATTVAATAHLAALAGIRVFATGGLGGVHRGALESFDESADLSVLGNTPITVVSAGVKSVLDLAATLERLETLSIPVVGYKTNIFPSFWLRESVFSLEYRVDSALEVAQMMLAQDLIGEGGGIVIANPVPESEAWEKSEHDRVLKLAFSAAEKAKVTGKEVTPFLLQFIVEASGGASLEVNLNLARNNVMVAAEIALAWANLGQD